MMQTMDCAEARVSLGVYVLGAIDPADRAVVDAHLAACRDCREELAGMAGLPALLSRVTKAEVVALAGDDDGQHGREHDGREHDREQGDDAEPGARPRTVAGDGQPPRELLGTVLDLTRARRRRGQWRTIGLSAAAAVIVAAAVVGGVRAASGTDASPPPPQAGLDYGAPISGWTTAHGLTDGMYGTVRFRQMGWGTQVAVKVVGVPVGTPCQLIAVGPGGVHTVIGGWTTDTAEGTVWYPASSALDAQQLRQFQITVPGHKPIVIPA